MDQARRILKYNELYWPPTFQSHFAYSKDFWNTWGWFISDMIVDVPIAAASAYYIIKGTYNTLTKHLDSSRFTKKSF